MTIGGNPIAQGVVDWLEQAGLCELDMLVTIAAMGERFKFPNGTVAAM